jgi:hypothetical protein
VPFATGAASREIVSAFSLFILARQYLPNTAASCHDKTCIELGEEEKIMICRRLTAEYVYVSCVFYRGIIPAAAAKEE